MDSKLKQWVDLVAMVLSSLITITIKSKRSRIDLAPSDTIQHQLMTILRESKKLKSHWKTELDTKVNGTKPQVREMEEVFRSGLTDHYMRDIGRMIKPTVEVD
jgi:hypothetical protein